MAEPVRVPVKKEIWHWALRESQKDEAEFYGRFPQAEKWLKQERNPTFKQLESAAKYLQIPFGYMFLDTPPKENVMEIEFRSISNKIPQISKDLQDTILEMDRRRNWMSDYRKDLGWTKLDIIKDFNEQKSGDIAADAKLAKRLLNLPEYWYTRLKDLDQTFGFLKEKLEHIGILVMRNGIVGNNTRRSLDINEFRAFMLYDDVAPLIFINNNDSKAGKIFSLIHEYFHVLFEQEDVVLDPYVQTTPDEQQINALTAEFLMPQEQIFGLWDRRADVLEQINRLSSYFKVSRLAFAIKLNSLGLVHSDIVERVRLESVKDFEKKTDSSKRANFYPTYYSRMSRVFLETVIRSVESGEIGYTYAFKLLGVKGKTFDRIKADVMPYG